MSLDQFAYIVKMADPMKMARLYRKNGEVIDGERLDKSGLFFCLATDKTKDLEEFSDVYPVAFGESWRGYYIVEARRLARFCNARELQEDICSHYEESGDRCLENCGIHRCDDAMIWDLQKAVATSECLSSLYDSEEMAARIELDMLAGEDEAVFYHEWY